MMRVLTIIILLNTALLGKAQRNKAAAPNPYLAAFYSAPGEPLTTTLNIFPPQGREFVVPLPVHLYGIAYSPDGRAVYGGVTGPEHPAEPHLCKIDLENMHIMMLPGSTGLSPSAGLTVSHAQDRVLVSGQYRGKGRLECGLYQLATGTGTIEQILPAMTCDYVSTWHSLSFSTDGRLAIAIRAGMLELINVERRSTRSLRPGCYRAAWSPDGKWIAAVENGGRWRTFILDTAQFKVQKILGTTEAVWSPDSKYLLALKPHILCPDHGTFEIVDVESGKRSTINSSRCKVYQMTTGWVSRTILP